MTWSLFTYLLPFAVFGGLWIWLRFVVTRRTTEDDQQSPVIAPRLRAAPVTIMQRAARTRSTEPDVSVPAPNRSRRAALLPIALVLGLSIVARALVGH